MIFGQVKGNGYDFLLLPSLIVFSPFLDDHIKTPTEDVVKMETFDLVVVSASKLS